MKINKYANIIEKAFQEYSKTNDMEKLRQRIKLYSSRVVIGRAIEGRNFDWLTKGVVANYNELRYRMDELSEETEVFLKKLYFHFLTIVKDRIFLQTNKMKKVFIICILLYLEIEPWFSRKV